jgi:hypothetical protein
MRFDVVALGGLVLTCLTLDPRFSSSNPVENNRYLRAIKIHSTTYFGEEVNSSGPMSYLWHVKNPSEYERYTS